MARTMSDEQEQDIRKLIAVFNETAEDSNEAALLAELDAERAAHAETKDSERTSFECFAMICETLTAHGTDCKNTPPMFINDAVHNALAAKNRELTALKARLALAEAALVAWMDSDHRRDKLTAAWRAAK